jgi:hypothetical protein
VDGKGKRMKRVEDGRGKESKIGLEDKNPYSRLVNMDF